MESWRTPAAKFRSTGRRWCERPRPADCHMTTAPRIDELQWIDRYFGADGLFDYNHLKPILCFSLIWNLFETHACDRSASTTSIRRSVDRADTAGRLLLARYEGFVR